MLFDKVTIERMQRIGTKDKYFKNGYNALIKECKEIDVKARIAELNALKKRADQFGGGKRFRYGNNVRLAAIDAVKLSMDYIINNNEKTLKIIVELLLHISSLNDWLCQGKLDGYFNADLWTGDITASMGIAYDTIKENLTTEQEKIIVGAIIKNGIKPIFDEWVSPTSHKHALDTMGHNWWAVIVCGGAIGLVSVGDKIENYNYYYQLIMDGIDEWFAYSGNILQNKKANFGYDGGFIEYIGYLSYALSNYTILDELMRKKLNSTRVFKAEVLEKLINYYMVHQQILESKVKMSNFGDTRFSITENSHIFMYLSSRFNRPDLMKLYIQAGKEIFSPYDLIFYPDTDIENCEIKAPLTAIYNHSGYATIRSGYSAEDWLFTMKAGESWNHNHRDIGTFIITAKGREFVVDSGTCTYSKTQYRDYYTQPQAHNMVMFNGQGQHADSSYCGTKYMGEFPVLLEKGNIKYLLADCTGPLMNIYQRYYRHVLFLDTVILMIDDLHTYEEGDLDWLLHYKTDISEIDGGFKISNNSEVMSVHNLFPKNKVISFEKGFYEEIKKSMNEEGVLTESEYLKITSPLENRRQKLINAFVLPYEQNQGVRFETDQTESMLVTKIIRKDYQERIFCNLNADGRVMHKNGISQYKEIDTDAFISYIKEDNEGNVIEMAMINGSFIILNGQTKLSSLVKFDGVVNYDNSEATIKTFSNTHIYVDKDNKLKRIAVSSGISEIDF